jgi:dethiobiotin synthetase
LQQKKQQQICIIGTDTDIGKTYVGCNLIKTLVNNGKHVAALKPIASGISMINNLAINEDAHRLLAANNVINNITDINPICFKEFIAPHIAAKLNQYNLTIDTIIQITAPIIKNYTYDYMIIEGCGGLLVPLNDHETYLDLLKQWQYPVVLVVGMKLGCLNHAILTYQSLINNDINVLGWIANYIDPHMPYRDLNLNYLQQTIKSPLLGINPYQKLLQPSNHFYEVLKNGKIY